MAHRKQQRARRDCSRINVNESHELQSWAKALGVSEAELRKAVAAAGSSAVAVLDYFGKSSGSHR